MKTLVIGNGAIGSLFYQGLYHQQPENTFLQSRTTLTQIGYSNLAGYSKLLPVKLLANLKQAQLVLVCLKSYQVKSCLEQLKNKLTAGTPIVLCHNGVGTINELPKDIVASHPILALLTTFGCKKLTSSHRLQTGAGFSDLGLLSGTLNTLQQDEITHRLNSALPPLNWSSDIKEKQWQKLAINAVINPITAINNIRNGEVNSSRFSILIQQLIEEIISVAKSDGVTFKYEKLQNTIKEVANKTAMNTSSMLADVNAKKRTEIDYINGYIVKLGKANNINIEANEDLLHQVNELSRSFT